jgi:glycosyltransferase involved in cell wall biosynthesis
MLVSVITPTAERARYLQGTFALLKQQTYPHWEWLVYDTSLRATFFGDSRITYIHDEGIVSIGEKRNRLLERAKGEIIVHFDDDDYYTPTYLEQMMGHLQKAAFFTLSSWFSYDTKTRQFHYWDTGEMTTQTRYILNALSGLRIREVELGPYLEKQQAQLNVNGKTGFGFSFAYRAEVLKKCHFPPLDFAEDHHFHKAVEAADYPITASADQAGMVIHVIHDSNTSTEYPQYRIPPFLVTPLFPAFPSYLKEFHEN